MADTVLAPGGTTPSGPPGTTVRMTVAQATVSFLGAQFSESDGVEQKLFAGCLGIFGHGNVAGIGQALLQAELSRTSGGHGGVVPPGGDQNPDLLPYVLGRNEQAMVHTAVAYARMKDRKQTWVRPTWADQEVDPRLTEEAP